MDSHCNGHGTEHIGFRKLSDDPGEKTPRKEKDVEMDVDKFSDSDYNEEDDNEDYDDDDDDDEHEKEDGENEKGMNSSVDKISQHNFCLRAITFIRSSLAGFIRRNEIILRRGVAVLILLAYCLYFALSMHYSFGDDNSLRLLGITCLLSLVLMFKVTDWCWRQSTSFRKSSKYLTRRFRRISIKLKLSCVLHVGMVVAFVAYFIIGVAWNQPRNMLGLTGMAIFVLGSYVCSQDPTKVQWRTVFWGLSLQILMAMMIMKTTWGHSTFTWLGFRVTEFLAHTDVGSRFVFGAAYEEHYMVFKVFPVIIFFSMVVSILYHTGVLQALIVTGGRVLSFLLKTTPTESISATANIFIGMTEAPLVIAPYLDSMTNSELHCVMTGGFATIAGGILATYILFKVPANHLLSASVMSAPAALVISKLLYPELKKRTLKNSKSIKSLSKSDSRNLLEAASNGAVMTIQLIANVVVNLIGFMALLHFVNSTMSWFGARMGYPGFSFQLICSYVFWPLAFSMGVDPSDCLVMAELIGTKTFINEFMAFVELSKFIKNRQIFDDYLANATDVTLNLTGAWMTQPDGSLYLNDTDITLDRGLISDRTVVIATYALCGFANFGSIGVQLGGLGALAPRRKSDLARLGLSAMIAGNVACFMTASVAGLLYSGEDQ